MFWRMADVDKALGPWHPSRNLLSITKLGLKDIERTAPNMKVMKVLAWPSSLGEHLKWRETSVFSWDMIVEEHSVLDSHGPKRRVGLFRPMNACM